MEFDETRRESLDRWLRMGTWSKREALMLICGADPDKPDVPHMHPLQCFAGAFEASEAFEEYQRLGDLWRRDRHEKDSYPPVYFISWAQGKNIHIPWPVASFEKEEYSTSQTRDASLSPEESTLNPKERASYLRVIAGLCDFSNIQLSDRCTVTNIKAYIEEAGLQLGEDTVRKIVKEVRDLLENEREKKPK